MSKRESVNRQMLIIKKIRKSPCTFDQISDYLELESEIQGYNFTISKRTFQRDLEDIRVTFNFDIQFDFSKKVYFLDSEEHTETNDRILEAFDTFNALNVTERISDFIHFEKRKPKGTENLNGLIHAIKNKVQINYLYMKFWDTVPTKKTVEPLSLKEFNNRWYLIAKDNNDQAVKTYALDRLSELSITNIKRTENIYFNVEEHYQYCFGIISPNELQPEKVVLSIDPHQGKYIKSLPFHSTQKIISDTPERLIIELKLCLTHDFLMELLSHGNRIKVLEPQSLIDQITKDLKSTLGQYSN